MLEKRNEFIFDARERKGKKGKYIIQFHSKETKRTIDFTIMIRKGQDPFFLVLRGLQRNEEEKHKEEMRRVINISEQRKEKRSTETMRANQEIHHLPSLRSYSDRFIFHQG